MKELHELNQIIYSILKIQIEFGVYTYEEHLPPIEEMAEILVVSVDTIRLAYRQLQEKGYVTLSKNIGTVVRVQYDEQEIEQHVQTYFAERKEMLLDICCSIPLLFNKIQLTAWKNISPDNLSKLEDGFTQMRLLPSYLAVLFLQSVYGTLKNDLLINLCRRLNMTYMLPLLSMKDHKEYQIADIASAPAKIKLYHQKDWDALQVLIETGMQDHVSAINTFYKTRITAVSESQVTFNWSSYKKASQLCYSVGSEILSFITRGQYPVGSFLPSLKCLAKEKQVSVSTIRHALSLLNDLGIVKTINGIGTQVLSMDQVAEHCNLSSPIVQKRLLDYKQSFQLFVLSCRDVAACTVSSIDEETKARWLEQLYLFERLGKLDMLSTLLLKFISQAAPYQTIRTVYAELYRQLFWAVPLRGVMGSQETINEYYRPHYHVMIDYLKNSDAEGFAMKLERILRQEFVYITKKLDELNIQGAKLKPVAQG